MDGCASIDLWCQLALQESIVDCVVYARAAYTRRCLMTGSLVPRSFFISGLRCGVTLSYRPICHMQAGLIILEVDDEP